MIRKVFLAFILGVVLTSCASSSESPPISDTPKPTSTATITPIPSQTNTITPRPTQTASSTPTITLTPFPFPTPEGGNIYGFSPNQEWVAWSIPDFENAAVNLVIQNSDSLTIWKVSPLFFITNDGAFIDISIKLVHWSIDGRYLYFTHYLPSDGINFGGTAPLKRLNLKSGNIIQIVQSNGGFEFSISSNSKYLAYTSFSSSPLKIIFRDLDRGQEKF